MVFTASLLGAQSKRNSARNKPASLLVVSLGKSFFVLAYLLACVGSTVESCVASKSVAEPLQTM